MDDSQKMEFQKYVIQCNEAINLGDVAKAKELTKTIVSIFKSIIPDIYDELDMYSLDAEWTKDYKINHLKDLELLKKKLEFSINTKGQFLSKDKTIDKSINVHANSSMNNSGNSTNTNTNTNTVDIKAELTRVRDEIEANEYISALEKEEINEKIDEIENVIDENPTNNKKWDKLKGVVEWTMTKGYKIGEMVLPIIVKSIFPDAQ